ncbi:MAG: Mrp/NBP35 family ATP-binding protein [Verrucomicrobia bacterium]|nr:Mrp/NBP35 family ATP-binding protein [Verrucomicrobiota bacterium]
MPLTEQQVRDALRQVHFPGYSRDIVSFGFVKSVAIAGGDVRVAVELTTRDASVAAQIQREAEAALRALPGVGEVSIQLAPTQPPPAGVPTPQRIEGVRRVIAIGSGKGGVGKSTVAVNLACALQQRGLKVGLLDADIYGPSAPKMLGTLAQPTVTADRIDPVEKHGLKLISMALLLDPSQAVIWRGPMIMKVLQQFTHEVNWAPLDVLLVDLPPGTGDAQISLSQLLALDGAVVVTTPQEVAMEVVRRGLTMFEKVNVPVLGLIENMSYYVCPHCGERDEVFGHDGARQLGVPVLFRLPLNTEIRACGDRGEPIVLARPDSETAAAFRKGAETLWRRLE